MRLLLFGKILCLWFCQSIRSDERMPSVGPRGLLRLKSFLRVVIYSGVTEVYNTAN